MFVNCYERIGLCTKLRLNIKQFNLDNDKSVLFVYSTLHVITLL